MSPGHGDAERAIAFSPLSLLFQILLLPAWLFVIVLQSLIELFGMAAYVWLVPNVLFRQQG